MRSYQQQNTNYWSEEWSIFYYLDLQERYEDEGKKKATTTTKMRRK